MTNNITFSIVTCTYNASQFLERTLKSVSSQTYAHVEHLIIDGVSKDDTIQMAREYADSEIRKESHHVVNVCSEHDNGLYDAMNKGIARASGDYVIFLNAGDKFADDVTLEKVARQLETMDALPGVVYGNTDIVDDQGVFLRKRRLQPPEHLTWKSFKHGMLVCHQAFYARTDIARATPYNILYRLSADVDWCIRVMKECAGQNLCLHNTHLTLCSYLDGGMTVKNHKASLMERFAIMRRHYGLATTIAMHLWFIVRGVVKK